MSKIKVVIFGGVSNEHDVSLISATNVIENIPKDKYEIMCIGITKRQVALLSWRSFKHSIWGMGEKS